MAINFLDTITVNSGTGSASTIIATGVRPVTITGGAIGSVAIGGSSGGWATGYLFTGYSGTNRGGFGAFGGGDSLTYYYIGDAYNDTTMVVQQNAGNVGIGTTSQTAKLDVNGDTIVRGNVGINGATSIDSPLDIAAASTGNNALFQKWYYSPNAETYNLQLKQTVTAGVVRYNFSMVNNSTAYNDVLVLDRGNVGIGTTSPSDGDLTIGTPKLHVAVGGTSGTFNLAARFQSTTSDADNTGTSILINSSNDRGLLIKAGRKDGDREVAYFDVVTSVGNTTNMLTMGKFSSAYNVGIGTNTPSQKLTVAGTIMSTATSNPTLILQDTTHSDITIKGDSGTFSVSNANVGQNITMLYNGSVGIGTTSPSAKLHVTGGYLRLEGVGCGIQMPDTSGNPLLAITTDQNTFAGCNIVNGWGNSSNTGVGVGTTRSDGTAFQVKTGVTLSAGLATNSGTQRLIVYGSGGTKLTKSLGVGTSNPSNTTGRIDASNDIVAYSSSDIRLKDNIKSIDKALDKVNKIQGIEFDWIEKEEVHGNSGHDVCVIAQEIEKVLPEVVDTRDNGYKAVKYEKLVPLLIEAIKDLSKQVDGLKRLI